MYFSALYHASRKVWNLHFITQDEFYFLLYISIMGNLKNIIKYFLKFVNIFFIILYMHFIYFSFSRFWGYVIAFYSYF